jgi:hypothetical protein
METLFHRVKIIIKMGSESEDEWDEWESGCSEMEMEGANQHPRLRRNSFSIINYNDIQSEIDELVS